MNFEITIGKIKLQIKRFNDTDQSEITIVFFIVMKAGISDISGRYHIPILQNL